MERVKFRTTSIGKGTISNIFSEPNSQIKAGDKIFTILMDNNELVVKSHIDGVIKEVHVKEGDLIKDKGLLCDILTLQEAEALKSSNSQKNRINNFDALTDIEAPSINNRPKKDDDFITELLNQKISSSFESNPSATNVDVFSSSKTNDTTALIAIKKELSILSSQVEDLDMFAKNIEKSNESKINDLQSKFGAINGRINKELAVQLKEISERVSLSLSDDPTKNIKERVNSLHSLITKTGNKLDLLSKKVEESLSSQNDYDDTILVNKIKTLNENIYNLKSKIDSIQEDVKNQSFEYDDSVIVAKMKSFNEVLHSMKNRIEAIEENDDESNKYDDSVIVAKIKSTNEALYNLKNKLEVLEENIDNLDFQYDDSAIVSKVKALNENLYSLKNKVDRIEKAVSESNYEYDDSALQSRIKALNENVYSFKNKFDEIEETISNLDFQYDDSVVVSRIKALNENVQTLNVKFDEVQENIDALDVSYDDSRIVSKIKSISEALSTINNKVESIDVDEIQEQIESKLNDLNRNNKIAREAIESKLIKTQEKLKSLSEKYDDLKSNEIDPSKFVSKNEIDKIIKNAINEHEAILKSKNKLDKLEEQVKDYKIDPSKFVNSSDIEKIVKSAINNHDSILKSKIKLDDLESKIKESKHEQVKFVSKAEIDKLVKNAISDHDSILKSKIKLDDLESKIKESKVDPSKFVSKSDIEKIIKSSINDNESTLRARNKISELESKVSTMNSYQKKIDKLELEIFSYKNALKDQSTQIKELEKIIKTLKPNIEFKEIKPVKQKVEFKEVKEVKSEKPQVKQSSPKKPKTVSAPKTQKRDVTNKHIEEIKTKHIKLRDFKRKYDLSKLMDFHADNDFHVEDANAPIRLDFIFYKAILQSLKFADIDNYDDITLPKFTDNKLLYKRLDIKDKPLSFIYSNQNKIAKKSDSIGVVSIIDDQIKDVVLEKFTSDKVARILIIFESLAKGDDDSQSLVIKFVIKSSVAENKILGFLDDLDRIIGSPELIK